MTNADLTKTASDKFYNYLQKHKNEMREQSLEGYYHADVVADAYKQGFSDGKKSRDRDIISKIVSKEIERFAQKSTQIYILSNRIIAFLCDHNFRIKALFISIDFKRPRVLLSVPENLLLNDEFVNLAYNKISEIREIYLKLFDEYLDIGLVSSLNLEVSLLQEDGFGYQQIFDE